MYIKSGYLCEGSSADIECYRGSEKVKITKSSNWGRILTRKVVLEKKSG